ncbi:YodC family protein [Chitinophaga rhizosphaerae]|uniref:YodC family protein n=1 Tax=Chitinophaga rhizosphaerae TaxID=1864947 RepID=UPI000F800832|nr:DUF2158 domain-containing protein [Chitinophaga rhizosphaerae]
MEQKDERIPNFKIGDQVRLKSGGPRMTIEDITKKFPKDPFTGKYNCIWFLNDELKVHSFEEETIELYVNKLEEFFKS